MKMMMFLAGLAITVDVDRSEDFFGFDSEYMAYVSWGATRDAACI